MSGHSHIFADALSPVPRARGTTDYQPQLTSSPPMSTASQPPTTYGE